MKRREIDVLGHGKEVLQAVKKGVLITTKADGKVNSMTISWGMLGIEWNYPIFIAFVREGRFTRGLLDKSGSFTVNIPVGEFNKKILGVCGSKSGRDIDKIEELGLTLVDSETIGSPAIRELPLTLECEVVYRQLQQLPLFTDIDARDRCYPQDVPGTYPMANKDAHVAYYGKIKRAYILEE